MDVNESNQPTYPIETPTQPIQTPVKSQKSRYLMIVAVLFLLIALTGGAYYLGTQNNKTTSQPQSMNTEPTKTPQDSQVTRPTDIPVATETPKVNINIDWNTYSSTKLEFSIKYPKMTSDLLGKTWLYKEYNYSETEMAVGFGPSGMGDYTWGVTVFTNSALEQIIKKQGEQFSDRKESRKNLTVNGKPALLVTVTTNQYPNWIAKTVYIEQDGKVYAIGNGAGQTPDFEQFYNSFKLSP